MAAVAGATLLQWLTLLFVSSVLVVVVIDGFVFVSNSNSNSNSNYNNKIKRRRSYLKSTLLHQTDNENNNNHNYNNINYTKSHSFTVCLVPPSSSSSSSSSLPSLELSKEEKEISQSTSTSPSTVENDNENENDVWKILTRIRRNLQDPGLFRWPPHVNLLYPFINLPSSSYYPQQQQQQNKKDNAIIRIMKKLRNATTQIEPFWITLNINNRNNGTGTFGTSRRGVLWLYPYSSSSFRRRPSITKDDNENENGNIVEPIIALQSLLEKEFPICSESLKSNGRQFIPHMTISSNFNSLKEAQDAQRKMITTTNTNTSTPTIPLSVSFWCQEIYLLERIGDNGQFMKRITIPLGRRNKKDDDQKISGSVNNTVNNVNIDDDVNDDDNLDDSSSIMMQYQYHDPLLKFIDMPLIEEDWIYKERMGLKMKRKINNNYSNNIRDDDDNDDGSESEPTKTRIRRRKKLSRSNTRSKRIRRSERNKKMKSKMSIPPPTKEEIEQKRFERKVRRKK